MPPLATPQNPTKTQLKTRYVFHPISNARPWCTPGLCSLPHSHSLLTLPSLTSLASGAHPTPAPPLMSLPCVCAAHWYGTSLVPLLPASAGLSAAFARGLNAVDVVSSARGPCLLCCRRQIAFCFAAAELKRPSCPPKQGFQFAVLNHQHSRFVLHRPI